MEDSFFLGKILGWYLIIISIFVLFRQNLVKSIVRDILAQRAFMFVIALITLIMGLLLVIIHHQWVMAWPVVITVLAWLIVLGGLLRLFFPDTAIKMGHVFLNHYSYFLIAALIDGVLGIYLLYNVYR